MTCGWCTEEVLTLSAKLFPLSVLQPIGEVQKLHVLHSRCLDMPPPSIVPLPPIAPPNGPPEQHSALLSIVLCSEALACQRRLLPP